MDTDCADYIALLANTPTQAKSLLYSLEQAARDIGLHVNTGKTMYMFFLSRRQHLHSKWWFSEISEEVHIRQNSVSSPEGDINMCLAKAWTAIDHIYQPLRSGRIWHKVNF